MPIIDTKSISDTIVLLTTARGQDKTICPSEVARKLWPDNWRTHMPEIREAAVALRDEGLVKITQGGVEILDYVFAGPIRIQLKGD